MYSHTIPSLRLSIHTSIHRVRYLGWRKYHHALYNLSACMTPVPTRFLFYLDIILQPNRRGL